MSLLAFMNYMSAHPDEMAAYKQDPQTFFDKHPDIALTGDDQLAVQGYYRRTIKESTTVFRVAVTLGPGANINTAPSEDICGEGTICLVGTEVDVYAHSEAHVFFAEPRGGTVSCVTLRHSYLHIPDEQNIYFDLHLCCTDPGDETDRPQVLYVRTTGKMQPLNAQQYGHRPVSLTIPPSSQDPGRPGYILATAEGSQYFNNPVSLRPGSCYDPTTKELVLNFIPSPVPSVEAQ